MKKLIILFVTLFVVFCGVWVFKIWSIDKDTAGAAGGDQVLLSAWQVQASEVPEVDEEWILDPEIPNDYIPVPGEDELYMVVDDNGNILQYRQRTLQDDGSWVWETVNPDIPDNYEATDIADVYKVTNKDGSVSYFRYVRNDDNTFAFVPVDENGKELVTEEETETKDSREIPRGYIRASGNVYAVYNDYGVLIGYKERKIDDEGNYYWVDAERPLQTTAATPAAPTTQSNNRPTGTTTSPSPGSTTNNNGLTTGSVTVPTNNDNNVVYDPDGTYTETETILSTETKGGWVITYQTIVVRVYQANGDLLSTKKEGPTEISRVLANGGSDNTPDPSKIASTLSEEMARVTVGLAYKDDVATAVLAEINTDRAAGGKAALTQDTSTDAYKLAATRAADMATYNHSDYDSPLYGSLSEMCIRFGVGTTAPTELLWKTTSEKTATAIASRLQLMSDGALMEGYSSAALAIVSKNGYYYIDMVLLK